MNKKTMLFPLLAGFFVMGFGDTKIGGSYRGHTFPGATCPFSRRRREGCGGEGRSLLLGPFPLGYLPRRAFVLHDRHGYYPFDEIKGESVSRTLECSFDDWCAAEFCQALGRGGEYVIGATQLPKVTLYLSHKEHKGDNSTCSACSTRLKTFTVVARNLSKENRYVKSVTLNGKPLADWKIRHSDIMRGGELVFEMSDKPELFITGDTH